MKRLLLILLFGIIFHAFGFSQAKVIIARNCDPNNNYSADRFAEIYNAGSTAVDLTSWTLENVQGGVVKFSWNLSGTISPGETKICGNADTTGQTITPDFTATWSGASWNGKGGDGTVLKNSSGTVVDSAVQHDATATFENKEMKRKLTVTSPSSTYNVNEWVFSTVDNANDVVPGFHGTVFRVTTAGILWGTASNWDDEAPTATTDAYIPGQVTAAKVNGTMSSPNICKKLIIASGGKLTIPVAKALTVSGNLNIDASAIPGILIVQSDSTGNGSLIVNGTVGGSAIVQRYVAAYSTTANGWHEIGSPVNNMAISGSDFAPGTESPNLDDLYSWDEATDLWLNYKVSANNITNFTNGKGYLVAYQTAATKNFTGTLNNADITFTNLSYNSTKGNGWHLLGNPYSSALKWGTANWDSLNVASTAKVWNESAGNYSDVAANGIIPSANGFFVQVTNSTNKLTIPAADRVHNATNNYKSASATQPAETLLFKVTSNANGYYDVSRFGFKPNATEGFDPAFDSHKLFTMVHTAPSLWTVSKKQNFSTDYIPKTTTAYDMPLHFKPGVSTVYHLSIKGVDSFNGSSFVLEDLKTGDKIDLGTTKEYDFSAEKGDDVNRFVLHMNGVTVVPKVNATNEVHIFSYGKTIYLNSQKPLNGKVTAFNLMGQKVYESRLNGAKKQQFRLDRQQGIYFVKVEEAGRTSTHKVFIK